MPDEHTWLRRRLDEVQAVAEEARDEARGAHDQGRTTNGRVDRLEDHMTTVRRTLWGSQDAGLHGDGGVVGWVRQTRREIRIVGALVVTVLPVVTVLIDRWLGG